ncbi:site-specific integrase [Thalassospiraceae bacterium LMO-SO8]|nr:site-specific integrase [Alphaproteobacteria bacterium LMO-S08]WND77883.1 site-specific integrase [Thalassospiraceae bacterium LMO-SO8]
MKSLTARDATLSRTQEATDQSSAISCNRTAFEYVRASVADNTRRAYRSDLAHFLEWGGSIPASDVVVADYLAAHAGNLSVATLSRRVASISKAHTSKGLQSPTTSDLIKATLRGIKRTHGAPQRASSPLLVEDLLRIMNMLGDSPKDTRDRALLLIGFAGGFRRSELVALDVEDIRQVRQGMVVSIRRSKTDQAGKGREIGIPLARGRFCPVKSLEEWLQFSSIEDGPIFRSVSQHGQIGEARLSSEAVAGVVKVRVEQVGLDPRSFSGHSLRAGLATSAAMAGVSSLDIRKQTGHRSDAALARYVRTGELFVNNAAGGLL